MKKKINIEVSDSLNDLFQSDITDHKKFTPKKQNKINNCLQCPPKISKVFVTTKAFQDMILMTKAANEISREIWGEKSPDMEIFCYVLTDSNQITKENPGRITEIYIPKHRASETAVYVSKDSIIEVQNYIKQNNKIILGWAHSHGHFEVYSSKTDDSNHMTLLNDTSNYVDHCDIKVKYVYGITVVESGEKLGIILTQYSCGHIGRSEDKKFDIIGEAYSVNELKNRLLEIKTTINNKVNFAKPTPIKSPESQIKAISEEFIQQYLRNLKKAKYLLYESYPEDADKYFEEFQDLIQRYDSLIMNNAEESFKSVSKKIFKSLKDIKDQL